MFPTVKIHKTEQQTDIHLARMHDLPQFFLRCFALFEFFLLLLLKQNNRTNEQWNKKKWTNELNFSIRTNSRNYRLKLFRTRFWTCKSAKDINGCSRVRPVVFVFLQFFWLYRKMVRKYERKLNEMANKLRNNDLNKWRCRTINKLLYNCVPATICNI